MLNLAIDIGNSRTKIGLFENENLIDVFSVTAWKTNEFFDFFNRLLPARPLNAIVANVNKPDPLISAFLKTQCHYYEVGVNTRYPIKIKYKTPDSLGADRIAASTAAHFMASGNNTLSITCGTCIIYDYTDKDGLYHGGAISPGIDMRLTALNNFSARLPLIKSRENPMLTGDDTATSILSGVINGMAFEIDGFIEAYKQENPGLAVFLSGGNMNYFVKQLKNSIFATPNIVLEGLNKILLFNVQPI
jgi:type III pantothenate kinase